MSFEIDISANIPSTLTKNHYENFPVASFLIPKYYRNDIALVYWFARTADDLADEGDAAKEKRLYELDKFELEFQKSLNGGSKNFYFNQLSKTINSNNLTISYFTDLLSAFKQDVLKKEYESYDEVLDYCRRSANPVGRILLELFKVRNEEALESSDKICTALQLTNFYQDTLIDLEKGRNYYPQDEMKIFNVTQKMFELKENNPNIKALVKHNVERAQILFDEGKSLLKYLNGRFKIEIKWTIAGGEKILEKMRQNNYDVFSERPKLNKIEFILLLAKNIF
ncbi:MAG: squalene synthase HpnC [Ignavibacterium sp.]|nr:squalene synthase HpnC [Ignavibacterium sp.]